MVTLNWGERDVDAGTAAMLVNIGPILLALLGGWLLHEGFPRRLAAGMAVSFGGVLVVGISESGGGRTSVSGVVLCVVAAVGYAAGVVGQKLALRHASAVQVTAFGCFTGTTTDLPSDFNRCGYLRLCDVAPCHPSEESPHRNDQPSGMFGHDTLRRLVSALVQTYAILQPWLTSSSRWAPQLLSRP